MEQLDKTLDLYLVKKAPFQIPARWKEVLVKYFPWITLVLLILALPAVLVLLGISAFVMPFAYMAQTGGGLTLAVIFLIATLVLEGMAIPGLLARKMSGWKLLYYSALLSAVYNLLNFNLGGLIIGTLISLYLLFQIR